MARKGRRRHIGRRKKISNSSSWNSSTTTDIGGGPQQVDNSAAVDHLNPLKRKWVNKTATAGGVVQENKNNECGDHINMNSSASDVEGCPEQKTAKRKKSAERNYTEDNLNRALVAITRKGMSFRKAAKAYGVPHQTLYRRVTTQEPLGFLRKGPAPEVPEEIEALLEAYLVDCARIGVGKTRAEVCDVVKELLDTAGLTTKFANNLPSESWLFRYFKRHPILKVKNQEHHAKGRSEVTVESVKSWFSNLEMRLSLAGLDYLLKDPTRLLNMDETSFAFNYTSKKVVGVVGETTQRLCNGNEKDCMTVALCFSAAGQLAPPMIVHPGKRVRVLPEHLHLNVWRTSSENGWMTAKAMLEFCQRLACYLVSIGILEKDSDQKKVLLFLDGQSSHFSYSVVKFCKESGIELVRFYPNSTHLLQPADCSVMKSAKSIWAELLVQSRNGSSLVDFTEKKNFPLAVAKIAEALEPKVDLMQNAFAKTGIYPFDSTSPDYNLLLSERRKKVNNALLHQESSWTDQVDDDIGDTRIILNCATGVFETERTEHAQEEINFQQSITEIAEDQVPVNEEESLILDEKSGLFVTQPRLLVPDDQSKDIDELVREEIRNRILNDRSNLSETSLHSARELLKKKLEKYVEKKTVKGKGRKKLTYYVTSKENIENLDNADGRDDDDWQCFSCKFFFSEEGKSKKKLSWVTCDACPRVYHVKCVTQAHSRAWKLVYNSKRFESFNFECESCCATNRNKRCCI